MKVFKFGGSSIRNAAGIRNVEEIVRRSPECRVVVISALWKTTNTLEEVVRSFNAGNRQWTGILDRLKSFHVNIMRDLFTEKKHRIFKEIEESFQDLSQYLKKQPETDYDKDYDQIVSFGEIWSSKIIHAYLVDQDLPSKWMDIREILKTDATFRDAQVHWNSSEERIRKQIDLEGEHIYMLQGFIAGTSSSLSTTLGREGSDYTAAILGNMLDAESVVVWKDVPGIMNADPAFFENPEKLDEISYLEAVELAFFGAKIIHPKTIKPLHNKRIPLCVKPFWNPDSSGTIIQAMEGTVEMNPICIKKDDQILITIRARDFSFMIEQSLGKIFSIFNACRIKINLIQNSAISLSVCADNVAHKVKHLIDDLGKEYRVAYNEDVQLITIRHYTDEAIRQMITGKEILIEQRSRQTVHYVLKTQ